MADYYYTDANREPAGPIPFESLEAMYDRGELAEGALVAEVGAGEWQEASEVFGGRVSVEASPSMERPAGIAPPVSPTGPIADSTHRFEPLAGWAFGLGMASWVCFGFFAAIPGVILGHMALGKLKATGNTDGASKVLAIIGLILSYLSVGFLVLGLFIGLGFGLLGAFMP